MVFFLNWNTICYTELNVNFPHLIPIRRRKMKRTVLAPILVFLGLAASIALMAGTSIFTPLVQFIHTGIITPFQAVLCLVFMVAGFAACYSCLNILCSYFVPRIEGEAEGTKSTYGR